MSGGRGIMCGSFVMGEATGTLYNVWELCKMCGALHNVWELCIMSGSYVSCVGALSWEEGSGNLI